MSGALHAGVRAAVSPQRIRAALHRGEGIMIPARTTAEGGGCVRWVRRALAQSGCGQNLVYLAHREGHALRHAHCDELFHLLKRREPRRDSHACALGSLL